MTLRKIRIALATVMFIGLTWLFVDFTGTARHWLAWMPKLQLLEAVLAVNVVVIAVLVVLTLVFGRIYCSVVCPLGIMQDLVAWLGRRSHKQRYSYSREVRWLRYPLLAVFIGCAALGVGSVVQLLAPYSAFGRIATMCLRPVWVSLNNMLATVAENSDSYLFYRVDGTVANSQLVLVVAAATFFCLAILAWRYGRTYCNTVCPVGTVLSLLSRFSWMKIRFDAAKCRNCSMCNRSCKASCIDYKSHSVDYSRCVVCGNCLENCKFGALKYAPGRQHSADNPGTHDQQGPQPGQPAGSDASRRSFLLSSALLTTAALAQQKDKLNDGGLAEIADKIAPQRQTPLTPPGSLSAQHMANCCTGCQLCVTACPNHVLRPGTNWLSIMQPTMSYELGYCRPECTRCSEVCPSGAIKPIAREVKASTQIGHAVWLKKNCVPLTDGVACGNCARHCPTGAIAMVASDPDDEESLKIPVVNEAACIGCGACENLCPARPYSAIYVEGHEQHREL